MWSRRVILSARNRLIYSNISLVPVESFSTEKIPPNKVQTMPNEVKRVPHISLVSLSQIKKTLSKLNCQYEEGYVCLLTHCSNCHDEKQGTIYINKVTGCFLCMDCQQMGEWPDIGPRVKKKDPSLSAEEKSKSSTKQKVRKLEMIRDYSEKWNELARKCRSIASCAADETKDIISLFKLQVSSNGTVLNDLSAVYDNARQVLYFPLSNGRKRIVGIMEFSSAGVENCDPFKQCPGVLRYVPKSVTKKNCENVILVASIRDLIALSSEKHSYHVICLPHGISALPQEILPLFEQYNRIILWLGNDPLNLDSARAFSEKLRQERCFFIKEIKERPSVYIEKSKNIDLQKILQNAKPALHKCITTYANLRQEVWSTLTNSDKGEGIKWQRFPALNEIIRGHRRGELTVLTGPTGSGKTTFLSEYSLDLAMQGVTTLWGSFEIRNTRLARTMLQQYAEVPLTENLDQFETLSDRFERLPLYFLKFHGQESINVVMDVVEHATYIHDIQHLVIDNLQFMMGLTSSEERYIDRFYKQDKVISAFRTFATQRDCHVTLIIHPKKEKDADELTISSIFGTAKASQESDNIMIIQKKMLESLHIKKYLQIVKNRFSGDLGIMPLNFNKAALSFSVKNVKKS